MSYYKYSYEDTKLWFTAKEDSYRTNGAGKDTWEAAQPVFPIPVQTRSNPIFYLKRKVGVYYIANQGPDPAQIAHEGWEEGMVTLNGPLEDFSLLYFLGKSCTTTDASPSAGKYTHVWNYATARPAAVPSFQMVQKVENSTSDEGIWILYTGCVVKKARIEGNVESNIIQGSFEIKFANLIYTTTDLSATETTRRGLAPYMFDTTAITFSKAGTAYQARIYSFAIDFDDGTMLDKADNELHPEAANNGPRKITLQLGISPKEKQLLYDFFLNDLAPETDSDVDCTIKTSRNTTTDYLQFAFQKLFKIENDALDYSRYDYYLQGGMTFLIKPTASEASGGLVITEVNAIDDDPYET